MNALYIILLSLISTSSFNIDTRISTSEGTSEEILSNRMKEYWYGGEAEISSYNLSQARYGELREGKAVLIFVTEQFSQKTFTKAEEVSGDNISILKLNKTKNFNTGIYPYSMMNSTFFPFDNGKHSLKVSSSVQEWCGHMYVEMRNKEKYEIDRHSYFEGESFNNMKLDKVEMEDDIWSKIRLQPDKLPIGKIKMLPSFFYFRFSHQPIKIHEAVLELKKNDNGTNTFIVTYPELERKLSIEFESDFPHKILGWEESQKSGFGPKAKIMTTKATQIKTIKSAYWQRNGNAYESMRNELGLE